MPPFYGARTAAVSIDATPGPPPRAARVPGLASVVRGAVLDVDRRGHRRARPAVLEIERAALGGAAELVERRSVVKPAVEHRVAHLARVADVGERVLVEHDEVGELAGFEGAEVLVEPEVMRAGDGARLQRLERRHAALG